MKKYIFFANDISNIGGAQLYILRKAKWLSAHDYLVSIVIWNKDPITLEEFNKYNLIYVPELCYSPNIFSKERINCIIDFIISKTNIDDYKKCFIESHQTSTALWGELFAKKVNCINVVYMIAPIDLKRKIYNKFFIDKLLLEELLGCNESYIYRNFNSYVPKNKYINNYFNIPFDKNEIVKTNDRDFIESEYCLNILTISRIDKTYIKETIKQISKFAQNDYNQKIKYEIYVDKDSGQQYEELKKVIESNFISNLKVYLKGPVIPLNEGIYENQDLFIGMGTSIINASSMRLPSLVIDYRNNKYYGYFGYNHFEFGTSKEKAKYDFKESVIMLIKDRGEKEKLGEAAYRYFLSNYENDSVNRSFLTFIENKKQTSDININNNLTDVRDLVDYILVKIFGVKKSLLVRKKIIDFYLKIRNFKEGTI